MDKKEEKLTAGDAEKVRQQRKRLYRLTSQSVLR